MDTLVDNRQFPPEMQQVPNFKPTKSTPWTLILLIAIAVLVIIFLLMNIFSQKNNKIEKKIFTKEEKVKTVQAFTSSLQKVNKEERQKKVNTFFN